MKIEAYSEKKAASIYEEQQKQAAAMKKSVSGAALAQAVSFTKTDNSMGMFGTSNYASEDLADKQAKTVDEVTDEAQALLDNMSAICNKMDTGELVAIDEDGVDVNDMDTKKLVTVGEQIRIKLAAAGNEHVYTGDIDEADIKSVYGAGSTGLISKVLDKYNLPMTDDNIKEIKKAVDTAHGLKSPDIRTKSYLMNNNLPPTAANLYKAEYSSSSGQADVVLNDEQWNNIRPQIEGMLDKAGIEPTQENMDEMKSLVEAGTFINEDTLDIYRQTVEAEELIEGMGQADGNDEINLYDELIADKAAATMVDGDSAMQVNLSDEPVTWKKAAQAVDTLENVTTGALLEFLHNNGYDNSLSGLSQAAENAQTAEGAVILNPLDYYNLPSDMELNENSIHTLRCLEELRLKMTFESAYILEKNGIDVNTQELSKLVEELKKLEPAQNTDDNSGNNNGLNGKDTESAHVVNNDNTADYKRFMYELGSLKGAPCAAIGDALYGDGQDGNEASLSEIEKSASKLERQYQAAGQAYETMGTQVRPDLGDKISNAVAAGTENVLKELNLDDTAKNRRAVRILVYNSMEVTKERVEKVKEVDGAVNNLFEEMTPDIALDMLRDGSDIMNMNVTELAEEVLARKQKKDEVNTQKFSEYLYEQDKKGAVSPDDRQQYMALYTIINKLTKDNGKAAGQLINQDMEATIGNLVTSYMINGSSGIEASASEDGTQYQNSSEHNNAKLNYYKELLSELSELPKQAAQLVTENNLPHTIDNLSAAGSLYSDNAYFFKELKKSNVDADLEHFIESMDNKKELLESYNELSDKLREAMNSAGADKKMPDMALLRQLSKGMTFMESLAKNNTFYVPYDSDNKTCAIKLSVVENSENAGSFTVDMEDENGGHISINAKVLDDGINAYVLSQSDCNEALESVKQELTKLGFSKVNLSVARTNQFKEAKNGVSGSVETRKLFAAAKVFVEKFR